MSIVETAGADIVEFDHQGVEWGAELSFPNTRRIAQYTHRIYNRYPARSISLVPRAILRAISPPRSRTLRVLDPFMGSGTTAVEASLAGHQPYGVEVDPLARMIAEVRVRNYGARGIRELEEVAERVSRRWRNQRPDPALSPRLQNIEYWFDEVQFAQLMQLKTCLYLETEADRIVRDFYRVTLADMIRPCSNAERQTLKPYISRKYAKVPTPIGLAFEKSAAAHIAAVREFEEAAPAERPSEIQWLGCDATSFGCREKVDVAITSPPYTNALDYVRCIKIESAWADCGDDCTFAELRQMQVGEAARGQKEVPVPVADVVGDLCEAIAEHDSLRGTTVLGYFSDMHDNLIRTRRALKPGSAYHLIVGDSTIRGVEVPTHRLLAAIAERLGYRWNSYYWYRIRDHRTSIPRRGHGGKINVEHVVSLVKE